MILTFFFVVHLLFSQLIFAQSPLDKLVEGEDTSQNEVVKVPSLEEEKGGKISYMGKCTLNLVQQIECSEELDPSKIKEFEGYFSLVNVDGKLKKVAYYDKEAKIQRYLLDREFNLSFNYVKIEYDDKDRPTKTQFLDTNGKVLFEIRYNIEKLNGGSSREDIRSIDLMGYSLTQRKLVKLKKTFFIYGGDPYKNVIHSNQGDQKYDNEIYEGKKQFVRYERYSEDGTIQYTKVYEIKGDEKVKETVYNKDGILISVKTPK